MKITHRAPAAASAPTTAPTATDSLVPGIDKAPRLSCCCRLSELLPLLRQAHDAAREARLGDKQADVAA